MLLAERPPGRSSPMPQSVNRRCPNRQETIKETRIASITGGIDLAVITGAAGQVGQPLRRSMARQPVQKAANMMTYDDFHGLCRKTPENIRLRSKLAVS